VAGVAHLSLAVVSPLAVVALLGASRDSKPRQLENQFVAVVSLLVAVTASFVFPPSFGGYHNFVKLQAKFFTKNYHTAMFRSLICFEF
jgi:hypothetical protein